MTASTRSRPGRARVSTRLTVVAVVVVCGLLGFAAGRAQARTAVVTLGTPRAFPRRM